MVILKFGSDVGGQNTGHRLVSVDAGLQSIDNNHGAHLNELFPTVYFTSPCTAGRLLSPPPITHPGLSLEPSPTHIPSIVQVAAAYLPCSRRVRVACRCPLCVMAVVCPCTQGTLLNYVSPGIIRTPFSHGPYITHCSLSL